MLKICQHPSLLGLYLFLFKIMHPYWATMAELAARLLHDPKVVVSNPAGSNSNPLVVWRPIFVKAPPPDVWCCCFMWILLLSIIVSWLVPAGVFGVDSKFPLWLHCDSSISDSLEIRNNVSTFFWISQINVAYLIIQLPCPNSRGWWEESSLK